mgnify:CR=1 FL=1
MLSDERIDKIAKPFSGMGGIEDYRAFARAIIAEVTKAGEPVGFGDRIKSVEHIVNSGIENDRITWDIAVAIDRFYAQQPAPCAKCVELEAEIERKMSAAEYTLTQLTAEVERLTRELAEAQKDAGRYRFLRSNHPIHDNTPFICRNFGCAFSQWTNEQADAAIDAAMRGKEGE